MKKILIILFLFISVIVNAKKYYVKTAGNNSNTGLSDSQAWSTLYKVHTTTFAAGDSVLFKRGNTWKESLGVSGSGTAGHPVFYGAYGTGAKPIFQPTVQVASWTQVGATDIYYGPYTDTPTNVFIGNVYVQPAHWPTTARANAAVFEYPSANSTNATHVTDSLLHGTPANSLIGTQVNMYTNKYTQAIGIVSAWDDNTHILSTGTLTTTLTTTMPYYLTAPAGKNRSYANKAWMMSENTWFYDTDAQRLYVWKTGGGSPRTVEVAAQFSSGISIGNKSNITIDNINIKYADIGIYEFATSANVCGVTIKNCETNYNSTDGIRFTASSSYVSSGTITDNIITYSDNIGIDLYRSNATLIHGNTVTHTNWYPFLPRVAYGIIASDDNGAGGVTIDGNTVSYCTYSGIAVTAIGNSHITNNDIDHTNTLVEDGGGIYVSGNSSYLLSGNTLTGGTGYGLYLDEGVTNSTVEHNIVTTGEFGVLIHKGDNNIVRYNKLTGPFSRGSLGSAIMISNYAETDGGSDIYNNIIDGVDNTTYGVLLWSLPNSLSNLYNNDFTNCSSGIKVWTNDASGFDHIKNNIFYNNATNINAAPGSIADLDYNLYYGTGNWIWGGLSKTTFTLWKKASRMDANSLNVDPLFVSANDFHLQATSPAINKGTDVGLLIDYDGHTIPYHSSVPDIGAYEFELN